MERAVGLEDAEQVVEAVVEGERDRPRGRGTGRRATAAGSVARPRSGSIGLPGFRQEELVAVIVRSRRPSSWMRACSRTAVEGPVARCPRAAGPSAAADRRAPRASDVATGECLALPAADAGDQAQVVVVAAALDALGRPAADVAVLDRLRIGRGRRIRGRRLVGHGREESVAGAPVVRHVVVDPQPLDGPGAATERDVQPLRSDALDPLELVDVRADLEDRARLDVAGELRVGDLVVVRAPDRRPFRVVDAQQEVGVAAPGPVEERGLVDDVRPGGHRGDRLGRGRAQPVALILDRAVRAAISTVERPSRLRGRRGSASRAGSRACG